MRTMFHLNKAMTGLRLLLLACAVLLLAACNDSNSGGTATLSGTAATGAAFANAAITVKDVTGATATTTSGTNGGYSVAVTGLTFPVIVQATSGGTTLYSWSFGAGTANITPLTTLALITSPLADNLDTVFSAWASQAAAMTSQAMLNAQATVNANMQTQFTAQSIPYTSYDFLKTAFSANGVGIDHVLDLLDFVFDYAGTNAYSIFQTGTNTAVTFDANISTAGITIGGSSGGGAGGTTCSSGWCLTVTGTVSTSGVAVNIPATTISGLPDAAVPTSLDGGNIQQSIQDSYGVLGTVSSLSWAITSSTATQVVAHLTFTVTGTTTGSYDLTYTYDKAGSSGGGSGGGSSSGAVTAPLAPLTNGAYYRLAYSAGMDVGIDQRKATANFSANGAMSDYAVILFDGSTSTQEVPSLGTAAVAELAGDDKVTIGRWNGGTTAGSFYSISPIAITANQGFHYAIGVPPVSLPADGTSKCYALTAATHPTIGDGSVAPGSVTPGAQVKIVFGATGGLAIDMTYTVGSNTIAVQTPGGMASPITFGSIGSNGAHYSASAPAPFDYISIDSANNTTTSAYIFLAGANSERLGMSFTRYQGAGGNSASLQGAAYFSETACQ